MLVKPISIVVSNTLTSSANFEAIANALLFGNTSKYGNVSKDILDDARFYLNVTAAAGTAPTLDVVINATVNGVQYSIGSFTQATAVTTQLITIANCPHVIQIEVTIGGTSPSFTFEVFMTR